MKILLLSFCFPEYCIKLANALSKKVEIKLMMPIGIANETLHFLLPEVKVELFNKIARTNPLNLLYCYRITRSINRFSPDILHLQCNGHAWFCFTFPFLRTSPKKIFTVHDPIPHKGEESFVRNLSNKYIRKVGDQFIVHGNILKNQMTTQYNIPQSKIHVIPIGDYNFNTARNYTNTSSNNILFFGRIQDYKGLEYLIRAEPIIARKVSNFKIIIAGTGKCFLPYENIIKNRERFTIINRHIQEKEIAELFQSSLFIVLPYTEASQTGVIPLAYSYGKPVIASRVGGLQEVVDDGVTGILIPPGDTKKLADAICTLLLNTELSKTMGLNAFKKIKNFFSWDIIAQKTIGVYTNAS